MLKIRLRRQGTRNAPFYRVVVSDQRRVPGSAAIEELGYFDPKRSPKVISLKEERIDYWVSKGAQMSPTVRRMRGKSNVGEDGQVVASETEAAPAKKAAPKAEAAPQEAAAEESLEEAAAEETAAEGEAEEAASEGGEDKAEA